MAAHIDAGRLDKPAQVLELRETSPGVWEWVDLRRAWANITLSGKTNLFSKVGVGARDAQIIVRRQALTPHQALRWGERHLFLTAVTERGRNHLDVSAAVVSPVTCVAEGYTTVVGAGNRPQKVPKEPKTFPGVLTEKYVRYEPQESYAKSVRALVLVTPKAVQLEEGDLVTVREGPAQAVYNVQACHVLDEYKNEYEILYSKDV